LSIYTLLLRLHLFNPVQLHLMT